MIKTLIGLCIFVISCGGHTVDEPSMTQLKGILKTGMGHLLEAYERQDPLLFTSLFAEDGMIVSPSVEPIRGMALIQKESNTLLKKSQFTDWQVTSLDIQRSGDLAVELSQYSCVLRLEGKNPIALSGRFLVVWKQQKNGSWLIQMLLQQPKE